MLPEDKILNSAFLLFCYFTLPWQDAWALLLLNVRVKLTWHLQALLNFGLHLSPARHLSRVMN